MAREEGEVTDGTRRVPGATVPDDELVRRQDALQAEAAEVLADLRLMDAFSTVGQPVQDGSSAYGLMVWRDIDMSVACPRLSPAAVFAAAAPLAAHPRVQRLLFRNETGGFNSLPDEPEAIYWGIRYVTDAGEEWTLDVWFFTEGESWPSRTRLETLPPQLTAETRLAILTLKDRWRGEPEFHATVLSVDVYDAVLEHGVRAPEEFERYLRQRGKLT